jgi:AAA domain
MESGMSEPFIHIRDRETALAATDPKMLVETIIPAGKLLIPWGDTGCGKTYWMAEIATAVVMRRPVFGHFKIVPKEPAGIAVIFAGEDCDYFEKSRLVAIERFHDTSLQGLVCTVDGSIPVGNAGSAKDLLSAYRDELHRLQDESGKAVEIIGNDHLKKSLGALKQNDDDAARQFTAVMEKLASEFGCTIICNAHQPKYGAEGLIAGSGDFTAACAVTPHLKAVTDGRKRLIGIDCEFDPKFRIGPKPDAFNVRALPVELPAPVAGFPTDLVFTYTGAVGTSTAKKRGTDAERYAVSTVLLAREEQEFTTAELGKLMATSAEKSDKNEKQWTDFLNNNASQLGAYWHFEKRGAVLKDVLVWQGKLTEGMQRDLF